MTTTRPLRMLPPGEAERLRRLGYGYPGVGATREHRVPAGCRSRHSRVVAGDGRARFEQLAEELLSWGLHRRAGLVMQVSDTRVAPGVVSVAGLPIGPVLIKAPCRVVYLVTERNRVAFAYGTLPGHPLAGEERFEVAVGDDDVVWFDLRLFSRPATRPARLGGPVTTAFQTLVNRRYLRAVRSR